jgi:ElaB/YqjD/DUF883 family membrane-anchored ribosome-binding protein
VDRDKIEDSAADAAGRVKEMANSAVDDAKSKTNDITRGAQDTYAQVRDRVTDAASVIHDSVQHQPLVALLVAGTLGCMLGLLLARR